jgi:hypothetical protein
MSTSDFQADGWVDFLSIHVVKGWVIYKKNPDEKAKIKIYYKGNLIATGIADLERNDLSSVGVGRVDFAISIPLVDVDPSELHRVQVYAEFKSEHGEVFEDEIRLLPSISRVLLNNSGLINEENLNKIPTVYYIVAPTSSGKTTSALRLGNEMGLPVFHADLIYDMLKEKYEVKVPASVLIEYELWDKPQNFGLNSWGEYSNMDEAKEEMYKRLIGNVRGNFIIEGFTLSFASERKIIEKIIGKHNSEILRIDLSYQDWLRLYIARYGQNNINNLRTNFEKLRDCFSDEGAARILNFHHPKEVTAINIYNCPAQKLNVKPIYITQEEFLKTGNEKINANPMDKNNNYVGYWKDLTDRWSYHKRVIEVLKDKGNNSASVLELGSMGISVVKNGHTIDYDKHLNYYQKGQPHYIHDARIVPWPVPTEYYDWFIALRVFHHLSPVQRECFLEAKRIAKNVLIVVPHQLPEGGGRALSLDDFETWNDGISPSLVENIGSYGYLYLWLKNS